MMDVKILVALLGIAGILITAIFSSAGYFYRSRLEGKKSAKKVLYLLLEIRHAIHVSIFDSSGATKRYIENYVSRLKRKGIKITVEDIEASLESVVEKHFLDIIEANKINVEERLLQPYEDSLSQFSSVSPILAYRLRGKEKIENLAALTSSYLKNLKTNVFSDVDEEHVKNIIIQASSCAEKQAIELMCKSLDDDILMLAKHCGWLEYYQCKKVISTSFEEMNYDDFPELDALIDMFFDQFLEAATKEINNQ